MTLSRSEELPALPYLAYNSLLWGLSPILPAVILAAAASGKRLGRTWRGQLGLELPPEPSCRGGLWIQAASVGENQAARPLVSALREALPGVPILLTSSTPEGLRLAREKNGADLVATFPFDFGPVVERYLARFEPRLCVMVETEIWPNLIRRCHARGVPLALVNGRLSPGRMDRYRSLRWFYRAFLAGFAAMSMQTAEDAERIVELGADPSRVEIAGDTKYDSILGGLRPAVPEAAAGRYLIAGSTHPGESETLLEIFGRLRARHPDLGLVLAPRHPETSPAAVERARELGLLFQLRSAKGTPAPGRVLILDAVGELAAFYGLPGVAFVGGSLAPVGGHSLLEPANAGLPVLFGPHAFNFEDAAALLLACGGGRRVSSGAELESAIAELLADPACGESMGRAARAAVQAKTGATARIVARLLSLWNHNPVR